MKNILLTGAFIITSFCGYSQIKVKSCGTDENLGEQMMRNGDVEAAKLKFDAGFRDFMKNYNPNDYRTKQGLGKKSTPKYIIPVVVHVFHANGPENISDAQIQSEIDFLNKSFRNLNSDTANRRAGFLHVGDSLPFDFKSLAADAEIEFRLARLDPQNHCTNGIVRVYTPLTGKGNDELKKLSSWDNKHYFNMWVCKQINRGNTIGIAGYAQFPFGVGNSITDGVMIIYDEFGNIGTSHPGQTPNVTTTTHESGHWFGLYHPFQIKGDSCGIEGDEIYDTPPTYFVPTSTEPLRPRCNEPLYNTCATEKPDKPDMQEAYMDYFIGNCASNMFTLEQKARMHYVLETFRRDLWTAENLHATGVDGSAPANCAPIAAFNTPTPITCSGNKITFYDYSYNSAVSSWTWSFPGGNPSTFTGQSPPDIQYDQPGTYDVSLTVTGPNGSNTSSIKNYINIQPATVSIPKGYYTCDWWYENNWQQNGWVFQYENPLNPFLRVGVSYNQNACMMLPQDPFNQKNSIGSLYSLISPSFNMEGISTAYFSFNYAFAQAALSATLGGGNTKEVLTVYTSTDCGKTWNSRTTIADPNISTIGSAPLSSSISFIPSDQSKWKEVMISGIKIPSKPNVKFKIEFKYAGGNNFFLDNVRVGLNTGISESKLADAINLQVSPNPFNISTNIRYQLEQQENVRIKVFDLLGKEVTTVFEGLQSAGAHSEQIEKSSSNLTAGFYIIEMKVGNSILSHKIIIE